MKFPLYTKSDWIRDKTFKANPYSQIDEEIFNNFLGSVPPLWIKDIKNLSDYIEFDLGTAPESIRRAFHSSEPVRHEKNFGGLYIPVYATFAYLNNIPVYIGNFPEL